MAPKDELLSECLRQQNPDDSAEEEEQTTWRDKPLHGMYHRQIEEVADIKKSYQWLENAGQKRNLYGGKYFFTALYVMLWSYPPTKIYNAETSDGGLSGWDRDTIHPV